MSAEPPSEVPALTNGGIDFQNQNFRAVWERFLATSSPGQQEQLWQMFAAHEDDDSVEVLDLGDIHTTPPLPGRYDPLPEVYILAVSIEDTNQRRQEKRLGISFSSFSAAKQHAQVLFVAIFDKEPMTLIFDDDGVARADLSETIEGDKTAVITVSSLPVLGQGFFTSRPTSARHRQNERRVRFQE